MLLPQGLDYVTGLSVFMDSRQFTKALKGTCRAPSLPTAPPTTPLFGALRRLIIPVDSCASVACPASSSGGVDDAFPTDFRAIIQAAVCAPTANEV